MNAIERVDAPGEQLPYTPEQYHEAEALLEEILDQLQLQGKEDGVGRIKDKTIRAYYRTLHDYLTHAGVDEAQEPGLYSRQQQLRESLIQTLIKRGDNDASPSHLAGLTFRLDQYELLGGYFAETRDARKTILNINSTPDELSDARKTIADAQNRHWGYHEWSDEQWFTYLDTKPANERARYIERFKTWNVQTNIPERAFGFAAILQRLPHHRGTRNIGRLGEIGTAGMLAYYAIHMGPLLLEPPFGQLEDETPGEYFRTSIASARPPDMEFADLIDILDMPDDEWLIACRYPGELADAEAALEELHARAHMFKLPHHARAILDITKDSLGNLSGRPYRAIVGSIWSQQVSDEQYWEAQHNIGDSLEEGGLYADYMFFNTGHWNETPEGHKGPVVLRLWFKVNGELVGPFDMAETSSTRFEKVMPGNDFDLCTKLIEMPPEDIVKFFRTNKDIPRPAPTIPATIIFSEASDAAPITTLADALQQRETVILQHGSYMFQATRPEHRSNLHITRGRQIFGPIETPPDDFFPIALMMPFSNTFEIINWDVLHKNARTDPYQVLFLENHALVRLPVRPGAQIPTDLIDERGYATFFFVADEHPLMQTVKDRDVPWLTITPVEREGKLWEKPKDIERFANEHAIPYVAYHDRQREKGIVPAKHGRPPIVEFVSYPKEYVHDPEKTSETGNPQELDSGTSVTILHSGDLELRTLYRLLKGMFVNSEIVANITMGDYGKEKFALHDVEKMDESKIRALLDAASTVPWHTDPTRYKAHPGYDAKQIDTGDINYANFS